MGCRTLVVVPRDTGRYDCRIAHWGVDADPLAQSRPLGEDWSASAVLDRIDATVERLVVLDGSIRVYLVCWLDPTLTDIADVALARTDDPVALRAWWTGRKSQASYAADSSPVSEAADCDDAVTAVRSDLLAALRHRAAAVHLPDDGSFLRGGS